MIFVPCFVIHVLHFLACEQKQDYRSMFEMLNMIMCVQERWRKHLSNELIVLSNVISFGEKL